MACSDWGSDVTTEGFAIGLESPSYTGAAFDNVTDDGNATGTWYAYDGGNQNTGWTGQDFGAGNEKTIGRYRIWQHHAQRDMDPKDWTFEASSTGAWGGEEVTLDTVTGYSFSALDTWYEWTFINITAYRYYRINVSANNGNATFLLIGEMEMYECQDPLLVFTYSNPVPTHQSTVYGLNHDLQLTTTVSGPEFPNYIYDASFYDASDDSQIGSTVSGLDSGDQATSTSALSTPSGTDYSWYVKSTSSGSTGTSQTYSFTNRFLAEGYTEIDGTRASGVPVRLYRRSTGVLVSGTESTGVSGTFSIVTPYNELHYAVALHPTDSGTNALIFDRVSP